MSGEIEDDGPILSLHLESPGPHTAQIFALVRKVTGVSPAQARDILQSPGSEIARDWYKGLRPLCEELLKLGATFEMKDADS
jgi:hypothetical protein